jgi:beta-lactamase superfamily II metal-dependent hydrolase
MAFEIDFLPVGEGEKSGDAIAMRFGNLNAIPAQQTVVVIDGGTKASGTALVEHIGIHYKTTTVNAVICTHSDADHASGLTEVLERCKVERFFMHTPWTHFADLDKFLAEDTTNRLKQHFKKSLDSARELEALAKKKGIQIYEPFADTISVSENFSILGPRKKFYESLLQSFRCAPESFVRAPEILRKAVDAVKEAVAKWVEEKWHIETLAEPGENDCSAENNSSVILLFSDGNEKFLFTSDAGVLALIEAANFAMGRGVDLKTVNALQVPHHGSKHNVGPAILDQILGPRTPQPQFTKSAIVSASEGAEPKHPSRRVVNAFMRRQAKVFPTQGRTICHYGNGASVRQGWHPLTPLDFFNEVEE